MSALWCLHSVFRIMTEQAKQIQVPGNPHLVAMGVARQDFKLVRGLDHESGNSSIDDPGVPTGLASSAILPSSLK